METLRKAPDGARKAVALYSLYKLLIGRKLDSVISQLSADDDGTVEVIGLSDRMCQYCFDFCCAPSYYALDPATACLMYSQCACSTQHLSRHTCTQVDEHFPDTLMRLTTAVKVKAETMRSLNRHTRDKEASRKK